MREIFLRGDGPRTARPRPRTSTTSRPHLAEAARLHLREKFLRAKVAVSGANFAVAETGTLVVVESEGNGRMCLTLPETLISVVGIEKVAADVRATSRSSCSCCRASSTGGADEPVHLDVDRARPPATARRRCTSC